MFYVPIVMEHNCLHVEHTLHLTYINDMPNTLKAYLVLLTDDTI